MNIRVIKTDNEDYKELSSQVGCILNNPQWLALYKDKLKLFALYNKNDELIGCFYLFFFKKFGLQFIIDPPLTQGNGFILMNPATKISAQNTFHKHAMRDIAEYLTSNYNKAIISFSFPVNVVDVQEFIWKGFKSSVAYTYHLDLSHSEEDLLANMSTERRKNINKAIQDGITCEYSLDKVVLRDLANATLIRQGIKLDKSILTEVLDGFMSESNTIAYVSKQNNIPISCSIVFYDKSTAYYLIGGFHKEISHEGAGALAMWNCILNAKEKGVKKFDFEGSMLKHIEKYFRGFGGSIKPYYRLQKSDFVKETALEALKRYRNLRG